MSSDGYRVRDTPSYATLAGLLARPDTTALEAPPDSEEPEKRRLALRIRNLGVDRFTVWAPGETGSVLDTVHDEGTRCAVRERR